MTDLLHDALTLTPAEGGMSAHLSGDFSNGPISAPPEAGFPFGGLLAALCAGAMRQGLEIKAPLRSLSVQYLAAARYGQPIQFRPRLLRGGRNVAYAVVEGGQGSRLTHHASATYGADGDTALPLSPLLTPPPPLDLDAPGLNGPMAPRFSQHVDYRFNGGPNILGGNEGKPVVERVWMRTKDGAPWTNCGWPICWTPSIRPPGPPSRRRR